MAKIKRSNLTFRPIPEARRTKESFLTDSSCIEHVYWKGRHLFNIYESVDFKPDDPHKSPEVERFFIRTAQEDHLKIFHGYARSVQDARDQCEAVAKDFEVFLYTWHNTKVLRPLPRPDIPVGEAHDSGS